MKGTDIRRRHLVWEGPRLRLQSKRGRVLATILPDSTWPNMWRVQMPDGHVSDMANLTRARDAAYVLALDSLNQSASHAEAPPMRYSERPVSVSLST
jgi:hypothetical protein